MNDLRSTAPANAKGLRSQRWRDRRAVWRPGQEVFNPAGFTVAPIGDREAKSFVVAHHYSGSYPAARLPVGLFDGVELVGTAVFSVPMSNAVLTKWTGRGAGSACELGRFVLLDRIAGNGETWFLARALAHLHREKAIDAVVAFSDPMMRCDREGAVVMPGHVGGIYTSSSAVYAGRTGARHLWLDKAGRVVSARALSKLANDERGAATVYDRLRAAGAPAIEANETGSAYVARALREGPFERRHHPGNFAFLLACGSHRSRRKLRSGWISQHGTQQVPDIADRA